MNITSFLRGVSVEPSVRPFARVERTISGYYPGRVYFQATYWPARLQYPQFLDRLLPGEMVTVVASEGLTLLVAPVQLPKQDLTVTMRRLPQSLPVEQRALVEPLMLSP